MKMENRGKNKAFIIASVTMILSKNYHIFINDVQEIDTSISISENLELLKNKYSFKFSLSEISNI